MTVYRQADLSAEQLPILALTYGTFRKRYGSLGHQDEAAACCALQVRRKDLDRYSIYELIETTKDGTIERWACRWILGRWWDGYGPTKRQTT